MNRIITFLAQVSFTTWLALYAAIVATVAVYLNWRKIKGDAGVLRLKAMIAKKYPDPTDRTYLFFNVVNIGKRPIKVNGLAYREKMFGKEHGKIICRNIPCTLNEGQEVQEIFENFHAIDSKPWSIYVYDSKGNEYRMKRRDLRRLYAGYDNHLACRSGGLTS